MYHAAVRIIRSRTLIKLAFAITLLPVTLLVNAEQNQSDSTTVVISIDGFANHYLNNPKLAKVAPNLIEIRSKHLASDGLTPVFPSKTFPNHISMVTGVYPQTHGIVQNKFYSKTLKKNYSLGAGREQPKWLSAKPIWVEAEKAAKASAIYFWPESEIDHGEYSPTEFFTYKHNTPNADRIEQIIDWLNRNKSKRPKLIFGYFSTVDSAGHTYGTNSDELANAISEVDSLIGKLRAYIQANAATQNINLVIVSDHGMVDIDSLNPIADPQVLLDNDQLITVNGQTQLYVYGDQQVVLDAAYRQLKADQLAEQDKRYQILKPSEYPAHWHFDKQSDVMPDLILNAHPPYVFDNEKVVDGKATHGYDPQATIQLDGIFLAQGPAFKAGRINAFENVHIYALIAKLIGLDDEVVPPTSSIAPFVGKLK
ncbi:alkaline phosphatase family protein [Shewanella sp. WXL01]|uniref:alkaline phosphatase family protein n=1 Tax=Shewanella sp. WXL01 TaxID=2709721 RepID=UPI0014384DBF|nr:ectonucleotide pyrophosphatase/phosphodiesterase [Shewanella sp. WXL01]NKF49605.1 alkaline phosphatase family protein [Shewanella sp. WXL01]